METCSEPGCGRPKGIEPWEHERYCAYHSDQLYRFIYAAEQRAQRAGLTTAEVLAREWLGERPSKPGGIEDV